MKEYDTWPRLELYKQTTIYHSQFHGCFNVRTVSKFRNFLGHTISTAVGLSSFSATVTRAPFCVVHVSRAFCGPMTGRPYYMVKIWRAQLGKLWRRDLRYCGQDSRMPYFWTNPRHYERPSPQRSVSEVVVRMGKGTPVVGQLVQKAPIWSGSPTLSVLGGFSRERLSKGFF